MTSNVFVRYGAIALVLIVAFVAAVKLGKSGDSGEQGDESVPIAGGEPISEETLAALGLEGDTESDTVATLVGEVRKLKGDIRVLNEDNEVLREDNSSLLDMEKAIQSRVERAVAEAARKQAAANQNKIDQITERTDSRFDQVVARLQGGGSDAYPVGGAHIEQGTVWVRSLDNPGSADSGGNEGLFGLVGKNAKSPPSVVPQAKDPAAARGLPDNDAMKPVYTIAKNSTLVGSTSMTALVGRVPFNGNITDPYSFKIIIGQENLIANGIELPEVAYSIASGKAVGDWTLGCVRGDLHSMTFVFKDGTIRTVPKPEDSYEGSGASRVVTIGELSDRFGNPCVVGKRITNAYEYLSQRIGITAVGAAAEAAAAAQTETTTGVGGGGYTATSVVTGSTSDYILGRTISDGTQEVADWLDKRQSQQFDAIYVRPGAQVAIHITEEIAIDYDEQGRKTHHGDLAFGGKYRELD